MLILMEFVIIVVVFSYLVLLIESAVTMLKSLVGLSLSLSNKLAVIFERVNLVSRVSLSQFYLAKKGRVEKVKVGEGSSSGTKIAIPTPVYNTYYHQDPKSSNTWQGNNDTGTIPIEDSNNDQEDEDPEDLKMIIEDSDDETETIVRSTEGNEDLNDDDEDHQYYEYFCSMVYESLAEQEWCNERAAPAEDSLPKTNQGDSLLKMNQEGSVDQDEESSPLLRMDQEEDSPLLKVDQDEELSSLLKVDQEELDAQQFHQSFSEGGGWNGSRWKDPLEWNGLMWNDPMAKTLNEPPGIRQLLASIWDDPSE